MKVLVAHLYLTLCDPIDCSLPGSSVHGILQARIPESSCYFLLQGIFPTQGSNLCLLCLLHWQADSLPLCHVGSPSVSSTNSKNLHTYAYYITKKT